MKKQHLDSFSIKFRLSSEAKAFDVGTLEVYRAVQIRQHQQGDFRTNILLGRMLCSK